MASLLQTHFIQNRGMKKKKNKRNKPHSSHLPLILLFLLFFLSDCKKGSGFPMKALISNNILIFKIRKVFYILRLKESRMAGIYGPVFYTLVAWH